MARILENLFSTDRRFRRVYKSSKGLFEALEAFRIGEGIIKDEFCYWENGLPYKIGITYPSSNFEGSDQEILITCQKPNEQGKSLQCLTYCGEGIYEYKRLGAPKGVSYPSPRLLNNAILRLTSNIKDQIAENCEEP